MLNNTIYQWVISPQSHNSILIQAKLIAKILNAQLGVKTEILHPETPDIQNKLIEICKSDQPLFWHFGSFDTHLFPFRNNTNIVFVYHNITPAKYFWTTQPQVAIWSILGRLQLLMMKSWHKWITMSNYNAIELRSMGFNDIKICPNVIICNENSPEEKTPHISLLYIGRIAPNKNCIALLDVAESIATCCQRPVELVVVGSAKPSCGHGKRFKQKLDDLKDHPWLSVRWEQGLSLLELECLYKKSWLYISTSLHEGFGVPACESVAHGTPALYFECGGQESVLEGIGMVPHSDRNAFTKRAVQLISMPEERNRLLSSQRAVVIDFLSPLIDIKVSQIYGSNSKI